MKKLFLIPAILATIGFSIASPMKPTVAAHAVEDTGVTLTAQEIIKGVYGNDLKDVETNYITYGVKAGYLTNGVITSFAQKQASAGDMSAGDAFIDWGGARLNSLNNTRIILSFQASFRTTISVQANNGEGWNGTSHVSYYKAPATYNEAKPSALTCFETYNLLENDAGKFTSDQLTLDVELLAGETFYWEWGFEWGGSHRTLEVANSNLRFTFTANDALEASATTTTLNLDDVYKQTAYANGGKDYSNGLVTYGMRFGDARTLQFVDVTTDGELYVTPGGNGGGWWQIFTNNGEGFAFTFTAKTRITINGFLTTNYSNGNNGWIDGGVTLTYVVARNGVGRTVYEKVDFDKDSFSAPKAVELVEGETLYISVVSDTNGERRSLMVEDASQLYFTATEVITTSSVRYVVDTWLGLRAIYSGDLCNLSAEDKATLNTLIETFDLLSTAEQDMISRVVDTGNYTIGQGIAYFRTLKSNTRIIFEETHSFNFAWIIAIVIVAAIALTIAKNVHQTLNN